MSALAQVIGIDGAAQAAIQKHGNNLTAAAHAFAVGMAGRKLHSRRKMFVNALTYFQEDENTWVINLEASARWIDEGLKPFNMLDSLLKSPKAKTAKDGSKYLVVPFNHSPGQGEMTQASKTLQDTIKSEFKEFDIPFGKIEKHDDGSPKLGMLHSSDITANPLKSYDGPGQGKGPIGDVRQGPTGIPFLQGIKVYQKMVKDSKTGEESAKRFIMTFRVASSKHGDQPGRWDYPGVAPTNIMEDTLKWALQQWNDKIAPQITASIVAKLT